MDNWECDLVPKQHISHDDEESDSDETERRGRDGGGGGGFDPPSLAAKGRVAEVGVAGAAGVAPGRSVAAQLLPFLYVGPAPKSVEKVIHLRWTSNKIADAVLMDFYLGLSYSRRSVLFLVLFLNKTVSAG